MTSEQFGGLLAGAEHGQPGAEQALIALAYDELRVIAHRHLRREFGALTLSTTALVNEAYLKIVQSGRSPYRDKNYFYAAASRAMRQIIVDLAREQRSAKRGGDRQPVSLGSAEIAVDACATELLELDRALNQLARLDPRLAQVVECRFYGGLSEVEVADLLGVTDRTVRRDWRKARAWLYAQLRTDQSDDSAVAT